MDKVLYKGVEEAGITYGGEYEVVRAISVCGKLLGFMVIGDDGMEHVVLPEEVRGVEQ